jgi:hypothetical protein
MHEKLSKGLTLGLAGNCFFVLFSIICFIYYEIFSLTEKSSIIAETLAYTCETLGFFSLIISDVLICRTVRMRRPMKFGYSVYIAVELVLMFLELNSFTFTFYKPYSLVLAICHSIFSGLVCFSFLSLDSGKKCLETIIIISCAVIMCGMVGNIFGIRIYFSILMNAISFIFLFYSVKRMLSREMIEIDCYGDKARVAEYKSTLF